MPLDKKYAKFSTRSKTLKTTLWLHEFFFARQNVYSYTKNLPCPSLVAILASINKLLIWSRPQYASTTVHVNFTYTKSKYNLFQPPSINGLPKATDIQEDVFVETTLYTFSVTDPESTVVTCFVSGISPNTNIIFMKPSTNFNGELHFLKIIAIRKRTFFNLTS